VGLLWETTSQNLKISKQRCKFPKCWVVCPDSPRAPEEDPSLKVDCYQDKLTAFHPPEQDQFRWSRVLRSPSQLLLHPSLVRLRLIDATVELNQAVLVQGRSVPEPILITASGSIISGFRKWHEAVSDSRPQVDCIECSLSEEEALEYIVIQHRPRRGWNNFTRVRLALELESHFQRKALANQIAGGKLKGSANLPTAEHIEVREEVASLAGVGGRTVANVKTILKNAAPALVDALQDGTLTINRALGFCSLPAWKQVEQFVDYVEQRTSSKVICDAINRSPLQSAGSDPSAVLRALQRHEARKPGSVVVRPSRRAQTVILLGHDLLSAPQFHTGLQEP
jgi:hypothetical protein